MTEVVVTTGAIRHGSSSQSVTTNKPTPSFLQAGCPSCHPTNSVGALKENTNKQHIHVICTLHDVNACTACNVQMLCTNNEL